MSCIIRSVKFYLFFIFSGFDLSTESGYESMMEDFDKIVGLKYLKAVHLNDSKGELIRVSICVEQRPDS